MRSLGPQSEVELPQHPQAATTECLRRKPRRVTFLRWLGMTAASNDIWHNDLDIKFDSKWPWMESLLNAYYAVSVRPENISWVWRPALYLYLCLFCIVAAVIRLRRMGAA